MKLLSHFVFPAKLHRLRSFSRLSPEDILFIWGSANAPECLAQSEPNIVRVEDGFLRSVGLGSDLIAPISWIFDSRGIYFDADRPSALEELLNCEPFSQVLLSRASQIIARIVSSGLTKYNVGRLSWTRPIAVERVILVVGQVETDASLQFGSGSIWRNIDLLRVTRSEFPDAYILYKPHPDVEAGLRRPGEHEANARNFCDEILHDVAIAPLLATVDEVHVMTSLAGFEALLRRKKVVCHGRPFYAGWGLTHDKCPIPRRQRLLSVNELVAGAILLYPSYIHPRSFRPISPELAISEIELALSRAPRASLFSRLSRKPRRLALRCLAR